MRFLKTQKLSVVYLLVSFIVGIIFSALFFNFRSDNLIKKISAQIKPLRQKNNSYTFINPLLGYEVPGEVKEFNEYLPLKDSIINSLKNNNSNLQNYSVYFRDLTLGRWMGINEDQSYAPASMMKVAIMIACFKEEENSPGFLKKTLEYSTSTADQINGVPLETPSALEVGKNYTVEELIQAMIVSSDNGAKNALLDNINQSDLNEIYTDLGLPNPDISSNFTISAKQYSLLLRVLFNATYLSRANSEEALKIMSQAKYSQALVAGVPKGTSVAQKFGENVDISNPNAPIISLSNCGIVYHPTHPYILCVMTKGTDLASLNKAIANISATVWEEVSSYALKQDY